MRLRPDGLVLSNGPGDPEPVTYVVETVRTLLGKLPILGICLGHQMLGLALGGRTYKLKFGHHGGNHPVKDLDTGRIAITAQNHGFNVDLESLGSPEPERGARHSREPVRRDLRGAGAQGPSHLQRAVPPRGLPGAARRGRPVRPVHRDDGQQGRGGVGACRGGPTSTPS